MGDVLKFKTEEDRTAAMIAVEETAEGLQKLDDIRNAVIEADAPVPSGGGVPAEKPLETPTPPPAKEQPPAELKTFTITAADLPEGFDTPGKVFKSFKEGRDLIERQTHFIKEKLQQSDRSESEQAALARAEKAERELEAARKATPAQQAQPAQSTSADIGTVQAEIKRIEGIQDELEKQLEADADVAYTADYQKKVAALSRAQTKNLTILTSLYTKAQSEIQETRQTATDGLKKVSDTVASVGRRDEQKAALDAEYKEMDAIDLPEYKLSRPSKDVESDYIQWREDVALAYFGRPARDDKERRLALGQLQLKNADIISKCQVAGVKTEPARDVQNYIELCEIMDYRDGWRKDPATGKLEQLLKYDPATGKQVPLRMPSLKAAIQQKRIEDGYYANQADSSFQQGAQSIAAAASRRDRGAVELNAGSDQGQTVESDGWANRFLIDSDEVAIKKAYNAGDKGPLNDLNKARAKFGMAPITFE
jgi:hypothetical protein